MPSATTGNCAGKDLGYNKRMAKIKVAVLRGGPSHEYDISLKTGANILSALRGMEDKYEPLDIFISKDGDWHFEGLVHEPHRALKKADVVWNALHGQYGEDGQVQKILDGLKIPYTGPTAAPAALSFDKHFSKDIYKRYSLLTPQHEMITKDDFSQKRLLEIFRNYVPPVVIKPAASGSSLGVELAHSFLELEKKVLEALESFGRVLVEELIRGKEATCAVVDEGRGERFHALLPVEIKKPKGSHILSYDIKYACEADGTCPGSFSEFEARQIEEAARVAHEALGLRHYSRSDFIVTPSNKIYILETNSLPGFTEESILPKSLQATGWKPHEFVDHVLKLTI